MGPLLERLFFVMPVTAIQTVSETSKLDFKSHDSSPTDPHQAIFIGRLIFCKNLEVIFRALARVIRVVPDAKLVVVGDGPMTSAGARRTMGSSWSGGT